MKGIQCISNSGTWQGFEPSAMFIEDTSYWCTNALQENEDVWCIFNVSDHLILKIMIRFQQSYSCSVVKIFTGESGNRQSEWTKIAEKINIPFNANMAFGGTDTEILFEEKNDQFIMLKFENWPNSFLGVERVKFYSE